MTPLRLTRRRLLAAVGSGALVTAGAAPARAAMGLAPVELDRTATADASGAQLRLAWRETYRGSVVENAGPTGDVAAPAVTLGDVLPGDWGSLVVRATVADAPEPVRVGVALALERDADGRLTEPEERAGDDATTGELADALDVAVWTDAGVAGVDPDPYASAEPCLDAASSVCVGLSWALPAGTGDVVQGDSVAFDVAFSAASCLGDGGT